MSNVHKFIVRFLEDHHNNDVFECKKEIIIKYNLIYITIINNTFFS